jgi:hypothetical protein
MCKATIEINKVKVSDLELLEFGQEIVLENEILSFGFTKLEILGTEYLVFGIYGEGGTIITIDLNDLNEFGYREFLEKISNEFDINLELIFDVKKYLVDEE